MRVKEIKKIFDLKNSMCKQSLRCDNREKCEKMRLEGASQVRNGKHKLRCPKSDEIESKIIILDILILIYLSSSFTML